METIVGGLFNAVAFAGTGFLFSKLNHTGYEKEIKRHNEAMEKLSEDKEKWYEDQVKRKEEIERLRQQLFDVNADINQTNRALKTLYEAQQREQTLNNRLKSLEKEYNTSSSEEPKLYDYYKPSEEMKEYQMVSITVIGLSGGYLIYKFL